MSNATKTSQRDITLLVSVKPPSKDGRVIVVSAAPEGELPIIKTGVFAQMHPLLNEVWAELQRRDPLIPDPAMTTEKPAVVVAPKPAQKKADGGKAEAKQNEALPVTADKPAPQDAPNEEQPAVSKDQISLFAPAPDGEDAATSAAAVIPDPAEEASRADDAQETPMEEQ